MTSSDHFKQLFERVRNRIRHVMSLTSLISRLTLLSAELGNYNYRNIKYGKHLEDGIAYIFIHHKHNLLLLCSGLKGSDLTAINQLPFPG